MSAFSQSFNSTQSATGTLVTMTDTSFTNPNDQGYVRSDFTRAFILTDFAGTLLEVITLDPTEDIATYELTEDKYINITLNYTGIADYSLTQSYPFMRITANKLQNALKGGCCSGKSKSNALNEAVNFIIAAEFAAPTTDAAAFQIDLDAANKFLDTIV